MIAINVFWLVSASEYSQFLQKNEKVFFFFIITINVLKGKSEINFTTKPNPKDEWEANECRSAWKSFLNLFTWIPCLFSFLLSCLVKPSWIIEMVNFTRNATCFIVFISNANQQCVFVFRKDFPQTIVNAHISFHFISLWAGEVYATI